MRGKVTKEQWAYAIMRSQHDWLLGLKKYTKFVPHGGWVLSLNLGRQLLALCFLVVLVRFLEQDAVGQFQLVVSSIALAGIFTLSGLGQAVVQSVARGYPGTFRLMLLWRLGGSLVGAGALVGFGLFLSADDPMRAGFIAAGIFFPLAHGLAGWTDFQAGEGKFKINALWQGVSYVLSYGGMMLALWLGNPGILWLVIIMSAALAVVNLVAIRTILRRVPRDAPPEPGALRYGHLVSIYGVANILGNHIDKVLIFTFMSPAALAIFVIAERIPEILKNYIQSLLIIFIPSFARIKKFTAALDRKIMVLNILFVVTLSFIVILLPYIFPILFSDDYEDAVIICQLLCATLLLGPTSQVRFAFLTARLDATSVRNVVLGANVCRIVSSFLLVPLFGIYGAVASTAVSRIAILAIVSLELSRFRV